MGGNETAQRRSLLHKSIKLAHSLASVLRDLGPSTFLTCRSGVDDEAAFQDIKLSEDTLHRELQSAMEARNASLPPVARLPEDVLRVIFTVATAAENSPAANSPTRAPMQLLGVSRRWRQIALETATLWRTVQLRGIGRLADRPNPWIYHVPGHYAPFRTIERCPIPEISRFCLEHSKIGSLNVWISVDEELDLTGLAMVSTEISRLASAYPDVHELNIVLQGVTHERGAKVVVDALTSMAPTLRKLSIHDLVVNQPIIAFTSLANIKMPRLRELSIRVFGFPTAFTFGNFADVELLSVDVSQGRGVSLRDVTGLLASCPRLTKLRLMLHLYRHLEPSDQPPAGSLPMFGLTFLAVAGSIGELAWFFSSLRAPNLRHLAVGYGIGYPGQQNFGDSFVESAIAVLSAAAIEKVAVEAFPVDIVLQLMEHLPKATMFSFCAFRNPANGIREPLTDAVLDKLLQPVEPTGRNRILPLLQDLRHDIGITSRDLPQYLDFLRAWNSSGRRLCTLRISEWKEDSPSEGEPPHAPDEISLLEESIARLVSNFIVGDWRFDLETKTWKRWAPGDPLGEVVRRQFRTPGIDAFPNWHVFP